MEIRKFHPGDMGSVMHLLQAVSKFEPKTEDLKQLANLFLADENAYACVAASEGRVIGFGSVFLQRRIRGGCSAVIEDVVVDEDFRRQGVGARIIKELLEYAKSKKCFKATLVAGDRNRHFYESLGFHEDNRAMRLFF